MRCSFCQKPARGVMYREPGPLSERRSKGTLRACEDHAQAAQDRWAEAYPDMAAKIAEAVAAEQGRTTPRAPRPKSSTPPASTVKPASIQRPKGSAPTRAPAASAQGSLFG